MVSQLLTMLAVGQSSMMLLSKVFALSERKIPTLISKLIECASLLALALATGAILVSYQSNPPSQAELDQLKQVSPLALASHSLSLYYENVALSVISFAMVYGCFHVARLAFPLNTVGWGMGAGGLAVAAVPIIAQVQVIYPKPYAGYEYVSYAALAVITLTTALVGVSKLTESKQSSNADCESA
ncbi:Uncharacterised protein [Mycobacteroides abscessus subsp. abscessus]|nr:Uncharacterised protein [Mycobacteroides abscessus subsp. abscessus]SHY71059.1 Uncharacterised protein [Mycobacteroides abscessus subsp. abscessus]SHZ43971.1 Uncharacterised protein [Mycobacteroides abscessus subsp. abscessus]SKR90628.1 Uncharacterised protein [Mycobacteroides abscessus subsp. abscessus]